MDEELRQLLETANIVFYLGGNPALALLKMELFPDKTFDSEKVQLS